MNWDEAAERIRDGQVERLSLALSAAPDLVQSRTPGGMSLLMLACMVLERSESMVRLLIERGSNVRATDDDGNTALHHAVDVNGEANLSTWPCIGLLARAGADLEAVGEYGWTPLMKAVLRGTPSEVACLLAHGADVTRLYPADTSPRFAAGETLLMASMANGYAEDVFLTLLRAGADPHQRSAAGETFVEYARRLLREAPANGEQGCFAKTVRRCLNHLSTGR